MMRNRSRRSGDSTRTRTRRGPIALVATLILLPGALVGGPGSSFTIAGADETPTPTSIPSPAIADVGADRQPEQRTARGRDRSRNSMRSLGAEPISAVIEVAEDVSPEWAAQLRALEAEDPEALRRSIASNGRRLVALAVLRDREPELYRLKVAELRLQGETAEALAAYREAVAAGQKTRAAALLGDVRRKVRQQVDHDLRTRAEELVALDQQVRRLRDQLVEDSLNREARVGELLDELVTDDAAGDAPWSIPADR